ncbi:hypothetical protein RYX36_036633, partial [Vicia faba]
MTVVTLPVTPSPHQPVVQLEIGRKIPLGDHEGQPVSPHMCMTELFVRNLFGKRKLSLEVNKSI